MPVLIKFKAEEKLKATEICDDNSRCNPGKQDKLEVNGETRQTRILTDYLKNLCSKFLGENPNAKLSLPLFCHIRPANIKLSKLISRNSCLCTRHQNFAICNQALRKLGLNVPLNPAYTAQKPRRFFLGTFFSL